MGTRPKPGQSGYSIAVGSVIAQTWTHNPGQITEPSVWVVDSPVSAGVAGYEDVITSVFITEKLPKDEASLEKERAEEKPSPGAAAGSPKPTHSFQRLLLPGTNNFPFSA